MTSQKAIGETFGVGKATVSNILKCKDEYLFNFLIRLIVTI
jgi:hypothetical protein